MGDWEYILNLLILSYPLSHMTFYEHIEKEEKKGFHHQKERDCYLAACLWQKSNLIHCSAYWFHTYLVTIYTSPITTSRYHKSFDNSFPILKVYIIQKRNTLLPYLSALDFCNYPVWWTWFLVYFKLEFYRLQQAEKSGILEFGKLHSYFYIFDWKNLVVIK